VKDIRDAVEQAQLQRRQGRATVVLRRRGAPLQQGAARRLPAHVESGLFTFIGATTENPSFEVNSALLSRATVHVLKALSDEDLATLVTRAQALLGAAPLTEAARQRLVAHADGDARRLLNAYENLVAASPGAASLDEAALERALVNCCAATTRVATSSTTRFGAAQERARLRPDAALYWLAA